MVTVAIIISVLLIACAAYYLIPYCMVTKIKDSEACSASPDEVVLRFAVTSDVHLHRDTPLQEELFRKLFRDSYAYAESCDYKNLDAVVVCGDSVGEGWQREGLSSTRLFKRIVDEEKKENTEILMAYAGNHEFFSIYAPFYQATTGVKAFNSVVLKGCNFITVPQDTLHPLNYKFYTPWLKKELKKANERDAEKPIFVFHHVHVKDTVYGSEGTDIWQTDELTEALSAYPQIIDFSGHSHYAFNSPLSVYQGDFTAFNTGSLQSVDGEDGYDLNGNDAQAGFYIVEVHGDNSVTVLPYNIYTNDFYLEPNGSGNQLRYSIASPSDKNSFTYTSARKDTADLPAFPSNAAITVDAQADSAKISFPQATDGECVHGYTVTLLCGGNEVKKVNVTSAFFVEPMPKTVTYELKELEEGKNYTVSVSAYDCYGKTSARISADFRTAQ